jgi:hypothetical protein
MSGADRKPGLHHGRPDHRADPAAQPGRGTDDHLGDTR